MNLPDGYFCLKNENQFLPTLISRRSVKLLGKVLGGKGGKMLFAEKFSRKVV